MSYRCFHGQHSASDELQTTTGTTSGSAAQMAAAVLMPRGTAVSAAGAHECSTPNPASATHRQGAQGVGLPQGVLAAEVIVVVQPCQAVPPPSVQFPPAARVDQPDPLRHADAP